MTLNAESKYPTRRAYVVKLRGDAGPNAMAGRIENLVTGRTRDFACARELIDCLAEDLAAIECESFPNVGELGPFRT